MIRRNRVNYLCPYCLNDVGSSLIEYSQEIVTSPSRFELLCSRCRKTIEVRVSIRFDLGRQAAPEELAP
jgi:hypothetical protein